MRKLLTVILLFITMLVQAQLAPNENTASMRSGRVKGVIIDSNTQQPMEYANIAIYNQRDSSLVTGGITNQNGVFEITGLGFGLYYAEANFIGYEKVSLPEIRIIPSNQTVDIGNLNLKASTVEMAGVDVVAERQRIEYQIDKKVINVKQDINAAGGTAVDVLENTPSVEVDIDGNVLLRGSSSFTVLIDGRPTVLSGNDALRQMPASAIENIEIITNPSAKYDPDGMAGIINIVMKKNILAGFNGIINGMVGTGDKYRGDITMNYRTKKSNLFFGADWNEDNSDGSFYSEREVFLKDTTEYLISEGSRDFMRNGFNIRAGVDFYLTDKATLTLSGTGGEYGSERNGDSKLREYTRPSSYDRYLLNNNLSGRYGNAFNTNVNFQQKFDDSGTHKLDALLYFSRGTSDDTEDQDEYYTDPTYKINQGFIDRIRSTETETSNEFRMKIDYTKPAGSGGKLEAGLQSTLDREDEQFNFENYNPSASLWINNPLFTSAFTFRRDIHAGYFTWSGKADKLQYMAGLRGEYTFREIDQEKVPQPYTLNRFDLFPTGHMSLQATKSLQLMASYSRRINRPSGGDLDPFPSYMNQYTIRVGNPELKPEYSGSYQLSLMQRFGASFISGEVFYRTTNNLISRIQELRDGIIYMSATNVNRDFSLGSEIMGNFNITKWFMLNASFSVFNYRIEGELNGRSIDRESTNYSTRMNGSFRLTPDSRLQLTAFYRGPSVQAQGDMQGMFFSNLSYRHEFLKKKLTATLSVRDVLGTSKFEGKTYTDDFNSSFRFKRESQVVQLTLSYTINNYRAERNGNGNGNSDMGGGGRMDMEF
jgi:outer membrane receptor protein involved in Fe transport